MGWLFKSKKEKEEIRKQRAMQYKADVQAVRESPMTHCIKVYLADEFSGQDDGEILRAFSQCNFAILEVYSAGISIEVFPVCRKDEVLCYNIINFERLGYSDLNSTMVGELKVILFETLSSLTNMKVVKPDNPNDGIIMYPVKQKR